MQRVNQADETIVERARKLVASKKRLRWGMLFYAVAFLGMCGYFTLAGIRKTENLDTEQLNMGFIYGFAMAIAWVTFGIIGGLCLGKFLTGFQNDFRQQELLVSYHDRLRELGQLPDQKKGEPGASAGREDAAAEL